MADVPLLAEQNNRAGQKHFPVPIDDVIPHFETEIEILYEMPAHHDVSDRLAMLVVPDYWNEVLIVSGSLFASKLRRRSNAGVEMFVQGWNHLDTKVHEGCLAAFKARHVTAGDGAFPGLDREASASRGAGAKALIDDIALHRSIDATIKALSPGRTFARYTDLQG